MDPYNVCFGVESASIWGRLATLIDTKEEDDRRAGAIWPLPMWAPKLLDKSIVAIAAAIDDLTPSPLYGRWRASAKDAR